MIDPIDASAAVFNVIVTVGFAVYCWKLVSYFSLQTRMGKAWLQMFIAAAILFGVSAFAFAQVFELVITPVWWRNVSAAIFRAYLLIAVVVIFQAWKNLEKTT